MAKDQTPSRHKNDVSDNDDEFVTPDSSSRKQHKKFLSDEDMTPSVKGVTKLETNNDSESDSDEAPEEESNSGAAVAAKERGRLTRKVEILAQTVEKEKRRQKDTQLKKQKEASKVRKADVSFLPDELLEKAEQEVKARATSSKTTLPVRQHKRLDQAPKNKTIFKKGPITVKVLKANKQTLPPVAQPSIINNRDKFLNRRSVLRRAVR